MIYNINFEGLHLNLFNIIFTHIMKAVYIFYIIIFVCQYPYFFPLLVICKKELALYLSCFCCI